jgi:hypothetical protein
VYPISLTAAKRADAETRQVQETLRMHRKDISKAFSAFPRVVTVKHIGEEKLPEGEGEAYLNHVPCASDIESARLGEWVESTSHLGRARLAC